MASPCSSSPSWPSFPTCFSWRLLVSSSELLSFRNQTRRRRRTFNQFFTKTGVALIIGIIIMGVFTSSAQSRPMGHSSTKNGLSEAHPVYVRSSANAHRPLTPFSRQGSSVHTDEDEVSASDRFESQRNTPLTNLNEPDALVEDILASSNYNVNETNRSTSVDTSSIPLQNSDVAELLGNNSSMVVRVIVTSSSSSTSSGSVELDETEKSSGQDSEDKDESVDAQPEDEHDEKSLIAQPSSEVLVSTLNPAIISEPHQESSLKTVRSTEKLSKDEHLELKKLSKEQNERPDIFSAFYHAFAESASSHEIPSQLQSTQTSSSDYDKAFLHESSPTESTRTTVASFRIPFRHDYRQRPSSFQLFQQRRRLLRTRQLEEKLSTLASRSQESSTSAVEETARKLEFLAKKLDKIEDEDNFRGQQDKIQEISSALSSFTSPAQESFVQHSSSPTTQVPSSFTPGKVAVSVSHTKSVVASAATKAEKVGEVALNKNAKSETTFSTPRQEGSKIHGTYSYFTRPRPLIKSLPRYEDSVKQNSTINNKNKSHNHIFSRNFSTHDIKHGENGVTQESYDTAANRDLERGAHDMNHGESTGSTEGNDAKNHEAVNNNYKLQDRLNIYGISKDSERTTSPFSKLPESEHRPQSSQKRKITRTVSAEIADPSTHSFDLNLDLQSPARQQSSQQISKKSTQINWQVPERVWGEPAQVWGVPAQIWGEPARVWSEPSRIWSRAEKKKKPEEDLMQSDQPPEERKPSDEDDASPPGTFVILGEDETEGDSIDGDLGRPLMLHHFAIPQNKQKETVSVSSSVTTSVSSNKNIQDSKSLDGSSTQTVSNSQASQIGNSSLEAAPSISSNNTSSSSELANKKSGKKFGYVIEGANVRKYRVEERTPDGYIVGEYGVLNNQNAFLRGVRYTADGTINPRLIHEALMKFLSLRR